MTIPERMFTEGPLRDAARAGWHAARGEKKLAEMCRQAARREPVGTLPLRDPCPPEFVVAIDTREQKPYRFPRYEVMTLRTGDYSVVGLGDEVAVERKSKQDAYSSLGQGRARFEREMTRLSVLDYAAIVVEATLPDFLTVPAFSRMNPQSAVNSILAWSVKYRVCVFFAGDRIHGNALTYRLLEKYWRYRLARPGRDKTP